MINVLYIDGVGPWGGASRSLFESLRSFEQNEVEKYFVLVRGSAEEHYANLAEDYVAAIGLTRFDNTEYSGYQGLRWLVLLREIAHLPSTFYSLYISRKKWSGKIDLIHVNELTEIVPLLIAKYLFKVPAIVHVRSVTRNNRKSFRTRILHYILRNWVDKVIAIDETVRESLPANINVNIIHNSFTPKYAKNSDVQFNKRLSDLRPARLIIGFVGNLLKSKGIMELIGAAAETKRLGYDVQFHIVGSETRNPSAVQKYLTKILGLKQDSNEEVLTYIKENGLEDVVFMLGATFDIQRSYEKMDVICFPSYFNAPGRPVFEAAFSGVPSIVAIDTPKPDTLINYETGIAIESHSIQSIFKAIEYFYLNPGEIHRMGQNAKNLAIENFTPSTNSEKLLKVYHQVISKKI